MKKASVFLVFTIGLLAQPVHAQVDTWSVADDGSVIDVATGLSWQRDVDDVDRNFFQATSFCENLRLANSSEWRLPNVKELSSIIDFRRHNPSIDTTTFRTNSSTLRFWTSTVLADQIGFAYLVDFANGTSDTSAVTNQFRARCVR